MKVYLIRLFCLLKKKEEEKKNEEEEEDFLHFEALKLNGLEGYFVSIIILIED